MSESLPTNVTPGRRTPTFTAASVPAGLLRAHRAAVWAQLVVEAGTVRFVDEASGTETMATPAVPVTIVPDVPHHVVPSENAEFHVQFFTVGPVTST